MKIVGIGGGTGLPILLRGLRELSERQGTSDIFPTALVCVSDNGGSSGLLRRAFDIPAVGDLRNCLVALSAGDPALASVFQHRLHGGPDFPGHCFGNLIVAGLFALFGNLPRALSLTGELLHLKGQVLASTDASATLGAEFENGTVARGECEIVARRQRIRRVWLEPEHTPPGPGVLETIAAADAIVLGPGSLYTSILPNLLPLGVSDALRDSPALKIFVCNLMTEPGETDAFSADGHLRVLEEYLGPGTIRICLLNSRPLGWLSTSRYLSAGAAPVKKDQMAIAQRNVLPVAADLLAEDESRIRHDPIKLARLVLDLTRGALRAKDIASPEMDWLPEKGTVCAGLSDA